MTRSVVYPRSGKGAAAAAGPPPDDLVTKLLKYIPGEVIAFYVPIYALVPKDLAWGLWLVVLLSAAGTVGYLWVRADRTSRPRAYFYVLAVVAFFCWALGTSTVGGDLWRLPEWLGHAAIPIGVFIVPLVDEILTKLTNS